MAKKIAKASGETKAAAAAKGLPGRQLQAVSEGNRTYRPGNKRDEADLAKLLSADQVADLTARGVFASDEE